MKNDMENDGFFSVSSKFQNHSFFEAITQSDELLKALEKSNSQPILSLIEKNNMNLYHEFCSKYEFAKFDFINRFLYVDDILPYDTEMFDSIIEPLIPKCTYDEKREIFNMKLSFIPYLKFDTLREFVTVKNTIARLIMEGIKRLPVKPKYDKKPVLIIFTLQSPYEFDVDNIEIKYIVDALRYSGFFYDDSCQYVSYLVEGSDLKEHPLMNVKIVKKSSVKIPN